MNERLEKAAKVLMSYAVSSESPNKEVKSLPEYRSEAATVLVVSDSIMFAPENVKKAIEAAGFDPAEHLETFLAVAEELRKSEGAESYTLADMKKAWAKGHENGFFNARITDAKFPPQVFAPDKDSFFFSKSDLKFAEAAGNFSGFQNGVLSMSNNVPDGCLLGGPHAEATNPYREVKNDD